MANYANLKSDIAGVIRTNNNEEITGDILQEQLLGMVDSLGAGFQYKGVATPTTAPGTPDENVFYIASTAGTYTNFGGLVVAEGEVAILKYNGSWTKEVSGAATAAQVTQLGQEVVKKKGYGNGNLLDPDKFTEGYAIFASSGNISGGRTGFLVTDYIPVNGKDIISNALFNSTWGGAVYDSSKSLLRPLTTSQYTYTSGDAYIRLTFQTSTAYKKAFYGTL